MTIEQLRKAYEARPFRPFTIRVSGGGTHHVPHPESLLYPPGARTFAVADPDGTIAVNDLLLVGEPLFEPVAAESGRRE